MSPALRTGKGQALIALVAIYLLVAQALLAGLSGGRLVASPLREPLAHVLCSGAPVPAQPGEDAPAPAAADCCLAGCASPLAALVAAPGFANAPRWRALATQRAFARETGVAGPERHWAHPRAPPALPA